MLSAVPILSRRLLKLGAVAQVAHLRAWCGREAVMQGIELIPTEYKAMQFLPLHRRGPDTQRLARISRCIPAPVPERKNDYICPLGWKWLGKFSFHAAITGRYKQARGQRPGKA